MITRPDPAEIVLAKGTVVPSDERAKTRPAQQRLVLALEQQRRLRGIIAALNDGKSLDVITRLVRDAAVEAGGFDRAGVFTVGGVGKHRSIRGAWGTSPRGEPCDEHNLVLTPDQELLPQIESSPYLFIKNRDVSQAVPPDWQGKTTTDTVRIALRTAGETVGILAVDNLSSGRPILEEDIEALLPFCEAAAAAILGARREAARQQAENALHDEERRFRQVLETVQLVAVVLDRKGIVTFCNDYLLRLTGWERDEVLGQNWFDRFLPPDRRQEVKQRLLPHIARGTIRPHGENEILTRHGERRLIWWNNTPMRDRDGKVLGATSIGEDITERRRLEAQLGAAYERERRITHMLQHPLLPPATNDTFPRVSVEMLYEPALDEASIGGDFSDAFALASGDIALVVGDASGKGLAAASRTAEVKYALRVFLREDPSGDPGGALARLNRFVVDAQRLDGRDGGTFIALSLCVLNPATGQTRVSLAGAEPPLLLRNEGTIDSLNAGGMPLGIEPGETYPVATTDLAPGDLLLMTTDGLIEARRDGDFLGHERMAQLAQQVARTPATRSLRETGQAILDGALAFARGSFHDDVSLLLAERR